MTSLWLPVTTRDHIVMAKVSCHRVQYTHWSAVEGREAMQSVATLLAD
jgi:hypothetical protein